MLCDLFLNSSVLPFQDQSRAEQDLEEASRQLNDLRQTNAQLASSAEEAQRKIDLLQLEMQRRFLLRPTHHPSPGHSQKL